MTFFSLQSLSLHHHYITVWLVWEARVLDKELLPSSKLVLSLMARWVQLFPVSSLE